MVKQRPPQLHSLVYIRPREVNQLPNLPMTNSAAATCDVKHLWLAPLRVTKEDVILQQKRCQEAPCLSRQHDLLAREHAVGEGCIQQKVLVSTEEARAQKQKERPRQSAPHPGAC